MQLTTEDVSPGPCDEGELRDRVTAEEAKIHRLERERDIAEVRHMLGQLILRNRSDTKLCCSPI